MAKQIQAINEYRPQIVLGKRAEMSDATAFIARSTGLNESGIRQMLLELRNMRERAGLINARLSITSAPGEGTTVSAELPMPAQ